MTTTETPTTEFLKVERPQFDAVLRVGTPEFLAKLPSRSTEELQRGERWINELRSQKTPNTYLVFPVSQPKQLAAGKLYLTAMTLFRTAVRTELAERMATTVFGTADATTPVTAEV